MTEHFDQACFMHAGTFMAKPKSAAQKAGKPADGTAVFWKRSSFELRGSLQGAPKDWWELQIHVTWAMSPVGALDPRVFHSELYSILPDGVWFGG
jgi:hypothetical protein